MKRYDRLHQTNLTGLNHKGNIVLEEYIMMRGQVQINRPYVEFSLRSDVITQDNGDKLVVFPLVQNDHVIDLMITKLDNEGEKVAFLRPRAKDEWQMETVKMFQEALDKKREELQVIARSPTVMPKGEVGKYVASVNYDIEVEIEEVIINVPKRFKVNDDWMDPMPTEQGCAAFGSCNGGGGSGGGGRGPLTDFMPMHDIEEVVITAIKDNPFALIYGPCDLLKAWLATAQHTVGQTQINKLNSIVKKIKLYGATAQGGFTYEDIAHVQKLNDAYSTVVNMDYFPITVSQLPMINGKRATPEQFLNYIRTNINNFVDNSKATFTPYNNYGYNDVPLWNSSSPLGAVIKIDIKGPDNGSVIVSGYSSNKWTFTTIHEPIYGDHPVSGNRDFGFMSNSDGSYTFYTRGVDRLTDWTGASLKAIANTFGSEFPFSEADALWESFQDKIAEYVQKNGGKGVVDKNNTKKERPNWQKVKDVLDGKKPVSSLNKNCN